MAVKWTEEQKKVITLRDRNILVSAAAGSGKTAVLVQRILSKIMDPLKPVDIDRLLIMTFTRAAAGEMRERIERGLDQALAEDPDNEHLLIDAFHIRMDLLLYHRILHIIIKHTGRNDLAIRILPFFHL